MQRRGNNHRTVESAVRAHSHDVVADFAPKGNIPFVTTRVVFSGTKLECDVYVSVHGDGRKVVSDAPHFSERLNEFISGWF